MTLCLKIIADVEPRDLGESTHLDDGDEELTIRVGVPNSNHVEVGMLGKVREIRNLVSANCTRGRCGC